MPDTPKSTETDRAYLAGLVDTSGILEIHRKQKRTRGLVNHEMRLSVSGLAFEVAEFASKRFGGRIQAKHGAYTVSFVTIPAAVVLVNIFPYLKAKREQARVLLKFAKTHSSKGRPLSTEDREVRKDAALELQDIRRRERG